MTEGPHLIRLSRILELRNAPLDLLRVVEVSGTANAMVGISGLTSRFALNVPFNTDAVKAAVPDVASPQVAGDGMLNVVVEGATRTAAVTIGGAMDVRAAVDDVAPASARDAWRTSIEMLSAAGGVISNRTRFLTEEHAAIRLRFTQRDHEAEQTFQREVARLMRELALPDGHQTAWNNAYASAGHGAGVALRTECDASGPSPNLGFMFGTNSWDRAIDFVTAIADQARARDAAALFGILAGELGLEPRGVEVVLDANLSPDIMVWAYLRQTG